MFRRTGLVATFGLAFLAAAGCTHEEPVKPAPPLEVVVSQPVHEEIADWSVYTGNVADVGSVTLRSRVRGHIKEVCFNEGEEIKAGTKLFLIDSEPFEADLKQAEGQLTTWKAKLELAEERIKIYKPLAEKGTVSREELVQALSSKGEALGGIETSRGKVDEAKLNIGYSKITSPIDGKVGVAQVTKGNLVNANDTVLTTIVPVDPIYAYFYVNERALIEYQRLTRERAAKLPEGETLAKPKIPVELKLAEDVGLAFQGEIDFVDNRVDPSTGGIKIRAKFENPKGRDGLRILTPGLFARLRVKVADKRPVVLVADRAFLTDQTTKYLLAVNKKNNEVVRYNIKPSERLQDDGLRAVEAGLQGDEWIIVEGVNRARPGVAVAPKEAPMPRQPTSK